MFHASPPWLDQISRPCRQERRCETSADYHRITGDLIAAEIVLVIRLIRGLWSR